MSVLTRYLQFFLLSWRPGYQGRVSGLSWQRLVIMLLFWPLFLVVQLINGAGLLLDYVLFPDFRRVSIREPLFVVGVPRSGTTFLHRLLALDDRFTTTALWELLFAPSISQRYFWTAIAGLDRALGRPLGRLLHWAERRLLGGLDGVHKTGLLDPEEDYLGLIPVWGCFLMVLVVPVPALWRLTFLDRDGSAAEKTRLMRAYRRFVQRHLYFHGQHKQLLSKNPSFTPWIETLSDAFPDARFIGCLRNPSQSVPSQINSILIGAKLFDGRDTTAYWRQGFLEMLDYYYRHLLDALAAMDSHQQAISVMETLACEPARTVLGFYQAFGWQAGQAFQERLAEQDRRARSYQSGHTYSLENLGVDADTLNAVFGWVYDRYPFPRPQRPPDSSRRARA
ncbi:sulfotransferase [Alcanivorax sp. S6407]|uniref:sulfotransferase n=1 Tax=Alcanivorax sp. S6407 TaxID=2926424 RepID=UPI001FF6B855|nr:sulfotransferase [Alcanivorax sp. S6407]MCK0152731.1 sulfotransferase [Alcanivorax sp. S6407]